MINLTEKDIYWVLLGRDKGKRTRRSIQGLALLVLPAILGVVISIPKGQVYNRAGFGVFVVLACLWSILFYRRERKVDKELEAAAKKVYENG